MGSLSKQEYTHVVIGVIQNDNDEVLVSRRTANTHLPNLLEFPGGKIEGDELPIDALKREFTEELGIQVLEAKPLIQIPFTYSDRAVLLDVFCIQNYAGEIIANEGQELFWQSIDFLNDADFPAANVGIIRALKLPRLFPVTPDYLDNHSFLDVFEKVINRKDIQMIQLRSHSISNSKYSELAKKCADLCKLYDIKLVLNRNLACIENQDYSGIHLTSRKLLALNERPLGTDYIVGASCHDVIEVEKANALKLDYIFIGPLLEKHQQNDARILQWNGFAKLSSMSLIPAYAIGGVQPDALDTCSRLGGQGIAAIRAFWK